MKASVLIKVALEQGFYVRGIGGDYKQKGASEFMCHALDIMYPEAEHAKDLIMEKFNGECVTLFTHLSRHDNKYKSFRARWGQDSKACFNLRVKWYENLIVELESKGL